MFDCRGWCFPWAVTAAGATHGCLPKVDQAVVWELIDAFRGTHPVPGEGRPRSLSSMLDAAPRTPPTWPMHPHRNRFTGHTHACADADATASCNPHRHSPDDVE